MITGEQPSAFREPLVNIMLIDAPCAGEGMMRKDAEAVNQWNPALVQSCASLQRDIVSDSVKSLLPDGYLIYSTCSYSLDENIKNVLHYIKTHQLQSVQIPFPENWGIKTFQTSEAIGYQLYPHRVAGEGLFIAVLQNISSEISNFSKPKKAFYAFENVPEWLAPHLSNPEAFKVRKNSPSLELIAKEAEAHANEVIRLFPRAELTTQAGELKGKDFVPSHHMAMAGIPHENYEILNLNLEESLDYLERATHSMPVRDQTGWYLVRYEATVLGWAKRTAQGWKNHYPMNWRLRDRRIKPKA
jgi:NOL1/NOP2/fmu family ribosome biogenesis protein